MHPYANLPLCLIPLIFMAIGILMLVYNSHDLRTRGIVTQVAPYQEGGTTYNKVDFDYTVRGEKYSGTFSKVEKSYQAGDRVRVYYDSENHGSYSPTSRNDYVDVAFTLIGSVALAVVGGSVVRGFRKKRKQEELPAAEPLPREEMTEYYIYHTLTISQPGYVLEDRDRNVLAEMYRGTKELFGGKAYAETGSIFLTDCRTGETYEHKYGGSTGSSTTVGRTRFNSSTIRIDGMDAWELLQDNGVRIDIEEDSPFSKLVYHITRDGVYFATIETCGRYVHEEDETEDPDLLSEIPTKLNFRCWINGDELDLLIFIAYIIAETNESVSVALPKMKLRI